MTKVYTGVKFITILANTIGIIGWIRLFPAF